MCYGFLEWSRNPFRTKFYRHPYSHKCYGYDPSHSNRGKPRSALAKAEVSIERSRFLSLTTYRLVFVWLCFDLLSLQLRPSNSVERVQRVDLERFEMTQI